YLDFSLDEAFEDAYDGLIRNLHNAPELKKPAIGRPPAHIFTKDTTTVATAGKFHRLRDATEKGKQNTEIMLRDYLESLSESLETFRITKPLGEGQEIDELILERITQMRPYRDEF